jgi:hypothetical protein
MNWTLAPVLRRCALVFFDDILIYSSSYEEHLQHLHEVLSLLAKDQWVVKLKKCHFAKQEIKYLGHILSAQGVNTDPDKVTAVMHWPTPANVRELIGFLGLAGFLSQICASFRYHRQASDPIAKETPTICVDYRSSASLLSLAAGPMLGACIGDSGFCKTVCYRNRHMSDWCWSSTLTRWTSIGLCQ